MEILPGIHRISLPLPDNAHGGVNSYLIEDDRGWLLVDCGDDSPETLKTLEAALGDLGSRLTDIHTLFLSHGHSDHYGLAGTLVKLVKPRVLMHRLDWQRLRNRPPNFAEAGRFHFGWLERNGLSTEGWNDEVRRQVVRFRGYVDVTPDEFPDDGDVLQLGGRTMQILWTPGHTQGHLCLYDAEQRVLFVGDHILAQTTPHTSILEPDEGNPIGSYMESLRKVETLDAELALPGHGEPFTGLRRRTAQLRASHERRLGELLKLLPESPATGAEIASRLPWSRHRVNLDQLPPIRQRVALGQTLARLEVLRTRGFVHSTPHNGRIYYERRAVPQPSGSGHEGAPE